MTLDEIRKFRDQQPFRPFEIVLENGTKFQVPNRESIWVPPGGGEWIYVVEPSGTEHVHVSRIESLRLENAIQGSERSGEENIDMTIEKLREVMRNQPFRPLLVHLADGRALDVSHPDFIAISPSGRTAIVYTKDDASHFIDLLLVTDLEVKPQKGSNGQRRRKAG